MNEAGMTLERQMRFWGIALVTFILFLWVFSSVLLPFVAGMALAYLLDPVADALERRGLSRMAATLVILAAAILIFVVALIVVLPPLARQLIDLFQALRPFIPDTLKTVFGVQEGDLAGLVGLFGGASLSAGVAAPAPGFSLEAAQAWLASVNFDAVRTFLENNAGTIASIFGRVFDQGAAIIGILSVVLVTPVVAFYLLYDWDHLVARIDDILPRAHRETIRSLMNDIDKVLSGFVRGQVLVGFILGCFYALALSLIGLRFGLVIGLGAGLVSFIPLVGAVAGFFASIAVAIVQFWGDPVWILVTALIFFAGQFIEGNFLQPRILGEATGLHPVALMFALFAFGAVFGFLGLLVAVPAAAAIGVVARFMIVRYKKSSIYTGSHAHPVPAPDGEGNAV